MKKLLLSSAVCALAVAAAPAFAQDDSALKLNVGGYFKGYVTYHNQDEINTGVAATEADARTFDILRDTEVHFGGETTLDNGLTVGAQIEAAADDGDGFGVDESYVYMAGTWGRVNFGSEDGAAYLLQVAAPSADDNYDGIRQFVNPTDYDNTGLNGLAYEDGDAGALGLPAVLGVSFDGLDYDNDLTTSTDKITYLSPVFNGFQVGGSYTPDVDNFASVSDSLGGVSTDDVNNTWGSAYEGAIRYEGQFNTVGFIIGGGYTHVDLEEEVTPSNRDDLTEWNAGLDLDIGPFGLGAIYTENNGAVDNNGDQETWVVGADYTTGPFKLGASYLNREKEESATTEVEADRYTGGVVYTYGPGMTFRGSVSYVDEDAPGTLDNDSTSVLLGTQINF